MLVSTKSVVDEIIENELGMWTICTDDHQVIMQFASKSNAFEYCFSIMDKWFDTWCFCGFNFYVGREVCPEALQLRIIDISKIPL